MYVVSERLSIAVNAIQKQLTTQRHGLGTFSKIIKEEWILSWATNVCIGKTWNEEHVIQKVQSLSKIK